ncbi:hypothetical protein NP493_1033g00043 [Ridgeia piscesae]|uniref:Uncharacterized protein n=1 Tax=Ridgeia piscesae TaxID=27915 RepID=A0AAD9KIC4_RIDPI|nr:hypothetical protein NP493_1033g00043 [Ridgeia piscesae]
MATRDNHLTVRETLFFSSTAPSCIITCCDHAHNCEDGDAGQPLGSA